MYHFEKARRRLETDTAESHLLRLIAEQAEAMLNLGLTRDAQRTYEEVLPKLELCGLAPETARARTGLARCLLALGETAAGRNALAKAAAELGALGNDSERARVLLLDAAVAADLGDLDGAAARLAECAPGLGGRPMDVGMLGYHLARIAYRRGNIDEAGRSLAEAIAIVEPLAIAPLMADLLHLQGLLDLSRARAPEAINHLRSALKHVERVRGSLQAERFRAAFLGNRLDLYTDTARAILDFDSPDGQAEAFHVIEAAKSRSLLDQTRGSAVVDWTHTEGGSDAALNEQARRLFGEINALYAKLVEPGAGARAAQWRSAVETRERELTAIEDRLAAARGPANLFAPPVRLDEVQAALPSDVTLLEFAILRDELIAWVVTKNTRRLFRGLAAVSDVERAGERLRFQINRALRPGAVDGPRGERLAADARAELGTLWKLVIGPMADMLRDAPRVLVVPHGPLHALPLHALHDGASYWIERAVIGFAPSASVWRHVTDRPRLSRAAWNLIVGAGDELAPNIETEARQVAAQLASSLTLIGDAATGSAVRSACPAATRIHFACHARFDPALPNSSGLRLADRWLTLREIVALPLQADLVTLAACESGRSVVQGADELMGLYRTFLAAGARAVIGSHWLVHDEISARTFHEMYTTQSRSAQSSPADSLRQACGRRTFAWGSYEDDFDFRRSRLPVRRDGVWAMQ
ncbi:MAG: CHAT domain-containing protein [Planctomycetes bacterium]|nr:CHAT domain-containing protein [Planctomycetota bacterium]